MAEILDETSALESTTVYLWRNAKVVKGGKNFTLSALVVVGDRKGSVGIGYGKAAGAPSAIEKAQKAARRNIVKITLKDGTLPHEVSGRFCASKVRMIPAAPGTGVKAGATVRAILEMVGVKDCLTKVYGSTNQKNLTKAAINGLLMLKTRDEIAKLRGVEIESTHVDEIIEAGRRFMPKSGNNTKAKAPTNVVGQGRGGRNARGGGRGGRGRDDAQANKSAAPAQASTSTETSAPVEATAATETKTETQSEN